MHTYEEDYVRLGALLKGARTVSSIALCLTAVAIVVFVLNTRLSGTYNPLFVAVAIFAWGSSASAYILLTLALRRPIRITSTGPLPDNKQKREENRYL